MTRATVLDRDLRTMLRIVYAPDDADDGHPMPPSVLDALRRLVHADAVYFLRLDVERREMPLRRKCGPDVDDADALQAVFWSNYWTSPLCSYPDRTGDLATVTKMSDFATMATLRRTLMWPEFFRPYGIYRELLMCLPSPRLRTLRLMLIRGPGSDFSERDRGLLALLRPHLDARFRAWQRRRRSTPLTPRQRELMTLVAAGRTNGQIARQLRISEGTVRTHLENIFQRLQVTNRAAAVVRAFPQGYAEADADEASPSTRRGPGRPAEGEAGAGPGRATGRD
jgi:DNA-binding CsgD family transcriptional regulator